LRLTCRLQLTLTGNQYNFFTTYFNIGYIICIPISSFLMNSIIRPSIWLPTLERECKAALFIYPPSAAASPSQCHGDVPETPSDADSVLGDHNRLPCCGEELPGRL
jgi:hypothetical protein